MKKSIFVIVILLVVIVVTGCNFFNVKQINKVYWTKNTPEKKSGFVGLKPFMSFISTEGISFYFTLTNHNNTSSISLSISDCFKYKDKNGSLFPIKLEPEDTTITLKPNETDIEVVLFTFNPKLKGEFEFIFQSATDVEPVSFFVII
jgi:hypothetical protein